MSRGFSLKFKIEKSNFKTCKISKLFLSLPLDIYVNNLKITHTLFTNV